MSKVDIELPLMEYLKAVNAFLELLETYFLDMNKRMKDLQGFNNKMIENIEFAKSISEAGGVHDSKDTVH